MEPKTIDNVMREVTYIRISAFNRNLIQSASNNADNIIHNRENVKLRFHAIKASPGVSINIPRKIGT